MSNITKRALATSLRKLLERTPLDKITIQDLVDDAEVSRKTFYYHFQDIYDLAEWCIVEEGRRVLEGNVTEDTWQQGLRNVVTYLQDNRAMILNAYHSVHRRGDTLIKANLSRLVRPLMEDIFDTQSGSEKVDPEDRELILKIYSLGLVEVILYWIGSGMRPEGSQLVDQFDRVFGGSMETLIQKCLKK